MVMVGDEPIIWHIMKYYSSFGLSRFVIALGYQAESIRSYFEDRRVGPVVTDGPRILIHPASEPGWTIELVDTGVETLSGGRLKRLKPYLGSGPFLMTYCDGLADVDIGRLVAFHREHGRLATLTAVHPQARFGRLALDEGQVSEFREKVIDPSEWINGGFFVLSPQVLEYIADDATQWERGPLTELADDGELMAYRHESFWQCMDTLPEAVLLNELWRNGEAPWKRWERAISMASIGLIFSQLLQSTVEYIAA
jgi:glucose-1-phosphate cytidylyltransferase